MQASVLSKIYYSNTNSLANIIPFKFYYITNKIAAFERI